MPVSTRAVRFSRSMSRTRFMRETPTTMASSAGSAPPQSDVPAPRGIIVMPLSCAYLSTRETSSVERGSTTASGMQR